MIPEFFENQTVDEYAEYLAGISLEEREEYNKLINSTLKSEKVMNYNQGIKNNCKDFIELLTGVYKSKQSWKAVYKGHGRFFGFVEPAKDLFFVNNSLTETYKGISSSNK